MNKTGIKYLVEPMGIEPTTSRVRFHSSRIPQPRSGSGNASYVHHLALLYLSPRFLSFPLISTAQLAPELAPENGGHMGKATQGVTLLGFLLQRAATAKAMHKMGFQMSWASG